MKLSASFFEHKTTIEVARDLLGMKLVHDTGERKYSGWIVETEAYLGGNDQTAHSYSGRRTKRTEIMFGKPGGIYMYQMHRQVLLNIITMKEGVPEGVLIRALEPLTELNAMQENRSGRSGIELTNGPGKLTQALEMKISDYGKTLFTSDIWIETGKTPRKIDATERIGVSGKGLASHFPLRFTVHGNPYLSGKKGLVLKNHGF
ncbi:3-methyladenine DNA glycosylase [Listeria floridensis FSL S10-1187]|uniref:Putative 3-methyladenine DNA glycosylase n=1 Tax=Listeria floridensis FSL S10-1187 TaxID=1265817 RepID=A0ABN0RCY8_9LIST|nr:DNA-3-methyladenine glycosylase [Listeria floridensis]EUJ28015.1 3-methyladenine DNA glycosylase [Listeria floridensis FSL S10-1187]